MATRTGPKPNRFTFQWKIENVSSWWWLRPEDRIESPAFDVEGNEITKWNLWLYPKEDEDFIGIYLHREKDSGGADEVEVKFHLELLRKDGSISARRYTMKGNFTKHHVSGVPNFEERNKIFEDDEEEVVVEDTLTIQCTMAITGEKHLKLNHVFSSTIIKVKRRAFCCRIDNVATGYQFKDRLFSFDVVLEDGLAVNLARLGDGIQYISCNISIILLDGTKQNLKFMKYFASDLVKSVLSTPLCLPETFTEDILSLQFQFVVSIVEQFRYGRQYIELDSQPIGKQKYGKTTVLTDDFKLLYYNGIFSDVKLSTSTKTYSVHKGILSARSPIFWKVFNRNTGNACKDFKITNFEDDTFDRMLLYIYTDSLGDLSYEIACRLYKISNYYEIPSLKIRCSSFLQDKLCNTNAYEILALADDHYDNDLKNAAQKYIQRQRK